LVHPVIAAAASIDISFMPTVASASAANNFLFTAGGVVGEDNLLK